MKLISLILIVIFLSLYAGAEYRNDIRLEYSTAGLSQSVSVGYSFNILKVLNIGSAYHFTYINLSTFVKPDVKKITMPVVFSLFLQLKRKLKRGMSAFNNLNIGASYLRIKYYAEKKEGFWSTYIGQKEYNRIGIYLSFSFFKYIFEKPEYLYIDVGIKSHHAFFESPQILVHYNEYGDTQVERWGLFVNGQNVVKYAYGGFGEIYLAVGYVIP